MEEGPGGLPLAIRVSGNLELASERLISNEAGYRIELGSSIFVDTTVFQGRYADLLDAQQQAPSVEFSGGMPVVIVPVQVGNLLDARTKGVEVAGHWEPGSDWRVDANYSFLGVEATPHANAVVNEAPTDGYSPSHQWSLHTGGRIGQRVLVDGTLFGVGSIRSLDVPGYIRADARVEVRLPRQFAIAITGRNLTSRSHLEFGDGGSNLMTSRVPRSADISLVWRR